MANKRRVTSGRSDHHLRILGSLAEKTLESLRKLSDAELSRIENSLGLQQQMISRIRRERRNDHMLDALNQQMAYPLSGDAEAEGDEEQDSFHPDNYA